MRYSFIIPVYNRPEEVDELLNSLTRQTNKNFEVLIVEDGSSVPCKEVVDNYADRLDICYYFKSNSGPGQTRNYGAERGHGEYLIIYIPVVTYLRQLETAGTQIRGGRPLQKLNIQIRLDVLLQIHIPLLQKSLYAMKHAVYLPGSPVLGCLKHTGQTGINHRGWAAGLPYDYIASYLCHRNTSF